ncbi:beta-ketoacyl synthase N-terminal-like domain-containing protein [Actinocrispum wychmicini]|uniref:Beta-ketoacyl synthase-like protein n=1 Tax=Actinocrispum wychmicini TaxID=1213861 RepID=A0A4R2J7C6_9PSEU|nr:beta-ketoacyl synthase N-terminal-like domain-containing protein [Actinocrispum wychmicini]TCO54027.1 beta-ketoacyl synthase-like protein [Actinocrispum wychmicini]
MILLARRDAPCPFALSCGRTSPASKPTHEESVEWAVRIPSRSSASPVGVHAGPNVNRYRYDFIERRWDIVDSVGYLTVDIASAPGYLSTFVSYKLGLRGPSMTVLTACSTSLVAVHVACTAIRAGDCDMAIAGGVDVEFPFHLGYTYLDMVVGHLVAYPTSTVDGRPVPEATRSGT